MISLAHLQPIIPHYREEFFSLLGTKVRQRIFVYDDIQAAKKSAFSLSEIDTTQITSKQSKGFLFYNPFPLLAKDYRILILMLNFGHLTTWLLLLTKFLHHKKIILWGQGISVRRYLTEEKKTDWKLKWMIRLADGVWFYMDKEKEQWKRIFPHKPMVALGNTLSGVDQMLNYHSRLSKSELKAKYGILQETILIFCARFTSYRRVDLLLETIEKLDSQKFGFVIIGGGSSSKPDFSKCKNVYDFGAVYDTTIKEELFSLSDIYFQPGWVGLSIVEAMAYGLPIFTFKRSEETLQCVEYSYIDDRYNGRLFVDINECLSTLQSISVDNVRQMGLNARSYVKQHLMIEHMVSNAMSVIEKIEKKE